jgi:hypothetical protein
MTKRRTMIEEFAFGSDPPVGSVLDLAGRRLKVLETEPSKLIPGVYYVTVEEVRKATR